METLTGQREVLATPLLNYFEPLRIWLEKKNQENGEFIGWHIPPPTAQQVKDKSNDTRTTEFTSRSEAAQFLDPLSFSVRQSLNKIRKS